MNERQVLLLHGALMAIASEIKNLNKTQLLLAFDDSLIKLELESGESCPKCAIRAGMHDKALEITIEKAALEEALESEGVG